MSNIAKICFPCHSGHSCGGTNTISKEQRAQLEFVIPYIPIPLFGEPSECDLDSAYEWYKEWYQFIPFLKEYGEKIKLLSEWQNETFNVEELEIGIHESKIELFWKWEDYNGLYSTEGAMKALYHHEKDDGTWSKSETKSLIEYFELDYKTINNFEDLIEGIELTKVEV